MKKYAMMVLGCKVNDYEAHYLKDQLDKYYKEVKFNEEADIYIVFTCCVTNIAESKTRKYLHRIKNEHPNAYVVAIGCYPQSKNDEVFDDIDLVVGSTDKDKIKEYIDKGIKANLVKKMSKPSFENLFINEYKGKTRAYLKVQDGCNQYCSYCIIPYARGNERSGDFDTLINQAKILAKQSKEIVLTGIHTGRYNDGRHNLYDLLKELEKIDGLETIRLSSIEMNEISDEIIELIKNSHKIAHHLHIPVQAGSDEVLAMMRRPYSIKEYLSRIAYIRKEIPDISISTDIIVGFPGETEEMFEKTKEFVCEIRFSFMHIFPYAKKEGTRAFEMPGHINGDVKKLRAKTLANIQEEITKDVYKSYLNKEVIVLVEVLKDGFSFGHSKEYLPVMLMGKYKSGDMVKAKIIKVDDRIIGEVIKCY